jgi:predicted GNAT superfamily acetyltransferase
MTGDLTIRDLSTPGDYEQCVALQRDTWGDDFRELAPPALLQIAQKVGGLAVGAFDAAGSLVGFIFGLTGVREGQLTHWSHMLAVREDARDQGLGRQLKMHQRERLRTLGVRRIQWSYDPLVARNANLNLNGLRVSVLQYVRDMYGENPLSKTDSVIGTDRLVVEWIIAAPQAPPVPAPVPSVATPVVSPGTQGEDPALPDAAEVLVEIPWDIQALKRSDPDAAVAWRTSTRRALEHYLGRGYHIAGFSREPDASRCYYVIRGRGSGDD